MAVREHRAAASQAEVFERLRSRSGNIQTDNHRREVGPLQAFWRIRANVATPRGLEVVMRSRRRSPEGGVQAEKQQRYVQLIGQGITNSQACRIVGINRKTGNRWRYGRSVANAAGEILHYAPVKIVPAKPRSLRYLCEDERVMIADLLAAGDGACAIGRELGRAASTISREIRHNRDKDGRYRPHHAERAAGARAGKPRKRRIACDAVLADAVCELLRKRWSPEQVAHELRELFAGERARWLCPESIYQAIYDPETDVSRPPPAPPAPSASDGVAAAGAADRDADDRRTAGRGRRPSAGRSLGRRSDHGRGEPHCDRDAGGAQHQVPDPAGVPRCCRERRGGPRSDQHDARAATRGLEADVDMGSRQRARPPSAGRDRDGSRRVLLRGAFAVAAGQQREHERAAARLLPEGH